MLVSGQLVMSAKPAATEFPNFLQLPTQALLDEFGAGRHKPGSGSAAALLGLVACKMMQTVVAVTKRNASYAANFAQLDYVQAALEERHDPYLRKAVQLDSVHFDRYYQALVKKLACKDPPTRRKLADRARKELMPATEIPLDIAQHALEVADRGLVVYDLGARHARGDSGVAVSSALAACAGALFIVYLNLLQFREGRWAASIRTAADAIASRYHALQVELFRRVSSIQAEGLEDSQLQLGLLFSPYGDTLEDELVASRSA